MFCGFVEKTIFRDQRFFMRLFNEISLIGIWFSFD